jgi:type 1 glutamine amidotransferase
VRGPWCWSIVSHSRSMRAPRLRPTIRAIAAVVALVSSAACSPRSSRNLDTVTPVAAAAQASASACALPAPAGSRVLVFSSTKGFRHASIPDGIAAVKALGTAHGFAVEATEDATAFTDQSLGRFAAVVFMSTTGDVLDSAQQEAFQRYIRAGHGYVGVHSATDTEYDWPWYGQLVGAYFKRHPAVQDAKLDVRDRTHLATKCLPAVWSRRDEWYDFRAQPPADAKILLTIDETSYSGGGMGAVHPMSWFHTVDGGRAFYTELGHTPESYKEQAYLDHLAGGILWAMGR